MSANPHANGGRLTHELALPDFRGSAVTVKEPICVASEATRVLGAWLRADRRHGLFNCYEAFIDIDVIDRVPGLGERAAYLRQEMVDARLQARAYTREYGEDAPEMRDWTWRGRGPDLAVDRATRRRSALNARTTSRR